MEKTTTSVLIETELHKFAKENKISMSSTLEEALRLKMGLPDIKDELEKETETLKMRLNVAMKKLLNGSFSLNAEAKEEQLKDLDTIKKAFEWKVNNPKQDFKYNELIKKFCKKYNVSWYQAVALSESRLQEIPHTPKKGGDDNVE